MHTLSLSLALALVGSGENQTAAYPRPDLLMEPAQLARPETARKYVILDARPKPQYQAGHVTHAHWVDHNGWAKAFARDRDEPTWRARLAALGIGPASHAVVYDNSRGKEAARIWWILHYWGINDVRLLNGGWKGWVAAKLPVTKEEEAAEQAVEAPLRSRPELLATKEQILKGLKGKGPQLVDARSHDEHCGVATTARRNGTIPGAHNLEWSELLDPQTDRFKTATQLKKLFEHAGIDPQRPAVTYCQSGGRAAVMAFALELMGAPQVRNYYRSWAEWGNAEDTPVGRPPDRR